MKQNILCLILLVMTGTLTAQTKFREDLNCEQAMELIVKHSTNTNFMIIDVRTPQEFAGGHLENAILIDYKSVDFQDKISKLDKNKKYLVYCKGGVRSLAAVQIMEKQDFNCLYHLFEGYQKWVKSNYKTVKD